jgi:hypothetical protein
MTVVTPERVVASGGAPKRRSMLWAVALLIGLFLGVGIVMLVTQDVRPSPPWQRIGSLSELRNEEFLAVDGSGVILVRDDDEVLALSSLDGRGQPVTYCETSGYFDDRNHGSKFDRLGRYALGPAPRGLDRFAVMVMGDDVYVDRSQVIPGPARYQPRAEEPVGPFCGEIRQGSH